MLKRKVLIVEDEGDLRVLVAIGIRKFGYEVFQATDGEDGLAKAREIRPDIIISDVIMPKKDGNTFLKELRQSEWGRNIPVIILTARGQMKDYFEAMQVDDFMDKPFKVNELVQKMKKVFAKRRDLAPAKLFYGSKSTKSEVFNIVGAEETVLKDKWDVEPPKTVDAEPAGGTNVKNQESDPAKRDAPELKKAILVLEDDVQIGSAIKDMLERFHYKVLCRSGIPEGYETVRKESIAMVILKHNIKGENTEAFADRLKELPRFYKLPIIIYDSVMELRGGAWVTNTEGEKMFSKVKALLGEAPDFRSSTG